MPLWRAIHAVLGTRDMQGWTVQCWQQRALLPVNSLQPQKTCGAGEPYIQEGQSALESVLGYGNLMIQEYCENHCFFPQLFHHSDDYQKSCLTERSQNTEGFSEWCLPTRSVRRRIWVTTGLST